MGAAITLTRKSADPDFLPSSVQQHNWPLEVVASGDEMPSAIFVYHCGASNDAIPGDRFEAVATVHQLEVVPTDAGLVQGDGTSVPYYRSATLTLICESQEQADEVWTQVQADVLALVRNYDLTNHLITVETVEVTGSGVTVME